MTKMRWTRQLRFSPNVWRDYWSWSWLARWCFPLPILLWYSKKTFGRSHVWWQGEDCQLELIPRFKAPQHKENL
jgi:hypothetical protein